MLLHDVPVERGRLSDFSTRLDDWAVDLASEPQRWGTLEHTFDKTFTWLAANGGSDVLRKWDAGRGTFRGGFLNTSFEVFALGAGFHFAHGQPVRADLVAAAEMLWSIPEMGTRFATGLATQDRLVKTLPIGRKLMADPPENVTREDVV